MDPSIPYKEEVEKLKPILKEKSGAVYLRDKKIGIVGKTWL